MAKYAPLVLILDERLLLKPTGIEQKDLFRAPSSEVQEIIYDFVLTIQI